MRTKNFNYNSLKKHGYIVIVIDGINIEDLPSRRLSAFPSFRHHRRLVEKAQGYDRRFQTTSFAVYLHGYRYTGGDASSFALTQCGPCTSGLQSSLEI